jgi:hypothetical protein
MLIHDKKLGIVHSSSDPVACYSRSIIENHGLSGVTKEEYKFHLLNWYYSLVSRSFTYALRIHIINC